MRTIADRRLPAFIVSLLVASGGLLFAVSAAADNGRELALEECPDVVIDAVADTLPGARVDEVEAIRIDDRTLYVVEAKLDGRDIDLHVSDTGAVVQRRDEIILADAPAAVSQALLSFGGEVDDLERVTEGDVVTFEAEIERDGAVDLDVIVGFDGHVISQRDELD
jgi:uncharacterized membrane protein YkoI